MMQIAPVERMAWPPPTVDISTTSTLRNEPTQTRSAESARADSSQRVLSR